MCGPSVWTSTNRRNQHQKATMGKNGKQQLKRKLPASNAQQNEYLKSRNSDSNASSSVLSNKQRKKQKRQAAAAAVDKQSDEEEDEDEDEDNDVGSEMREIDELDFDDAFAAGLAFEQLESYEGALASFQAAVKFRPEYVPALSHLADVYVAAEQPQKAIKTYLQASKLPDADASIWFRLGITYMSQEQHDAAVESFHKSLALSAGALDAVSQDDDDNEEQQQDLMKAYSVTLAALANCCGEQGDIDGAIQVYREAVAKFSSNGNLHYNLATMLMAKGDSSVAQAIQCLERAIECSPETIEFYEDLIAYLQQHDQLAKVEPLQKQLDALRESVAAAGDAGEESEEATEEEGSDDDESDGGAEQGGESCDDDESGDE